MAGVFSLKEQFFYVCMHLSYNERILSMYACIYFFLHAYSTLSPEVQYY